MMTLANSTYKIPDGEERKQFSNILQHGFLFDATVEDGWFERVGFENLRVLEDDGVIVGGLGLVPMGQFFGGRRVSMTGFAGVGVRGDRARRGYATEMMRRACIELAEQGVALGMLYASTWGLYRRVGFEVAGSRFCAKVQPEAIQIQDDTLALREITASDRPAVEAFYREQAASHDGYLDRGPYIWRRLADTFHGVETYGVVVEREGALEGYLYYRKHKLGHTWRHRVEVSDVLASTPAALHRIWTYLRDLGSFTDHIEFHTAPNDPAFLVHPEPRFRPTLLDNWFLRILDLPTALEGRGYGSNLSGRIAIEVVDDMLPMNAGCHVLELDEGSARVTRGGNPDVRVDCRGLASVYSGFVRPEALALLGRLEGSHRAISKLGDFFRGSAPWVREMF